MPFDKKRREKSSMRESVTRCFFVTLLRADSRHTIFLRRFATITMPDAIYESPLLRQMQMPIFACFV